MNECNVLIWHNFWLLKFIRYIMRWLHHEKNYIEKTEMLYFRCVLFIRSFVSSWARFLPRFIKIQFIMLSEILSFFSLVQTKIDSHFKNHVTKSGFSQALFKQSLKEHLIKHTVWEQGLGWSWTVYKSGSKTCFYDKKKKNPKLNIYTSASADKTLGFNVTQLGSDKKLRCRAAVYDSRINWKQDSDWTLPSTSIDVHSVAENTKISLLNPTPIIHVGSQMNTSPPKKNPERSQAS